MAEAYFKSSQVKRALRGHSSPPSSSGCSSIQTQPSPDLPPRADQQLEEHGSRSSPVELPPPPFFEELFLPRQTPVAPFSLATAFMLRPVPKCDVVKQGYLKNLETKHKRYFVLREGSHTGPSRLEWYKSREKFIVMEKSAGTAPRLGSSKQGVIYLRCCLGVSRISKKGLTVALYAKNKTMVLIVEDQWEQNEWYVAIKKLMEEERNEQREEDFNEESDCYCTLPPADFFKEVWPVTIKSKDLGRSKSLAGESRLCLSATDITLVKVCENLPSVSIPLLSVRCFGHSEGFFFLELGRFSPSGPGEMWMDTGDKVSSYLGRSQISTSPSQRPVEPCKQDQPDQPEPRSPLCPLGSQQSSTLETENYVEKKIDHPVIKATDDDSGGIAMAMGDHCSVQPKRMEKVKMMKSGAEKLDYMMSPQSASRPRAWPQDDYMPMEFPLVRPRPVYPSSSSPQKSSYRSWQSSTRVTEDYVDMTIGQRPVIKATDDDDGIAMATGDHCSVPAKRMEGRKSDPMCRLRMNICPWTSNLHAPGLSALPPPLRLRRHSTEVPSRLSTSWYQTSQPPVGQNPGNSDSGPSGLQYESSFLKLHRFLSP
ncbi:hypothetical protein LDENG_00218540 [Lucifuga dentata]|nr:hypothetical protein LDENG_00218540 [Lucifuga dentata]